MINILPFIIIAAIGGVAVTLQAQFIGLMDQKVGTLESIFITYFGGGLLIAVILLGLRGGNLSGWRNIPWYALTAGACGLVIIGTIGYSVPRLGLVPTFTILIAVQYTLGALFDHYGWLGTTIRPFDATRLVGVVVLLIGTWLIIR